MEFALLLEVDIMYRGSRVYMYRCMCMHIFVLACVCVRLLIYHVYIWTLHVNVEVVI
jgi:hypothetical protein